MKLTQTLLTVAAMSCFASFTSAQTTFIFEDHGTTIGAGLDDSASGSFTVDGIEMTASTSADNFNATSSGFGINQSATGDDTDGIDFATSSDEGIVESFTLVFDQAVTLGNFVVSSFGASDEVTLTDGANTVATITSTGLTSLGSYSLGSSSTLTVTTTAGSYGNGWSFDSITVSAVPEPGTYALLAGFSALSFVMLRRRSMR
jgi:hypothetical protein